MQDQCKTKKQLIDEMTKLRQRLAKLEAITARPIDAPKEAPLMTGKTIRLTVQSAGTQTILVVEDNCSLAEFEEDALTEAGYKAIVAATAKNALEIYRTRREEISLVILDLLMPEMSGRDCLMELVKIDPSVKILITSGYSPIAGLRREIGPFVKAFVHKPFSIAELLNEVRSALGSN